MTNDNELIFKDRPAAEAFGAAYIQDEEPGAYFEVVPQGRQFLVNLYEADGYWINQPPPPRRMLGGRIVAPRRPTCPHLG
jgi:hypothetical protein